MTAPSQADIKAWLRTNRGNTTQEDLAADIVAVTGWHITRDRYSKYEGSLPIGKKTLGHFVDYWKSKGVEGPSSEPATSPKPEPTLAQALSDLAAELGELRKERTDLARQVADLKLVVGRLVGLVPGASEAPRVPDGTAG